MRTPNPKDGNDERLIAGQVGESAVRPLLLRRRHTPDNVSSLRPESPGPYSEDTQIRTPDNGGYAHAAACESATLRDEV